MIYYKVCRVDNNRLYSICGHLDPMTNVEYKIGEWAQPNIRGSKLMVFKSLQRAKQVMQNYGWNGHIYTCEVKKPSSKGIIFTCKRDIVTLLPLISKLRINHKKYRHHLMSYGCKYIQGTIFCDEVKLLEKVK